MVNVCMNSHQQKLEAYSEIYSMKSPSLNPSTLCLEQKEEEKKTARAKKGEKSESIFIA